MLMDEFTQPKGIFNVFIDWFSVEIIRNQVIGSWGEDSGIKWISSSYNEFRKWQSFYL